MNWAAIGSRIRTQREYLGYTREQFAELLEVTPKFCSDIELGVKGMSVPTLCKIAHVLRLSTDFILFGTLEQSTHILLENVPGLAPTSLLLLEQLRTIDRKRLRGYIGRISKEKMLEVDAALAISIGIGYPNESLQIKSQ